MTKKAQGKERVVYPPQDPMELDERGGHYARHVEAMTREGLHSKAEIAEQLAWRDAMLADWGNPRSMLRQKLKRELMERVIDESQGRVPRLVTLFEYHKANQLLRSELAEKDALIKTMRKEFKGLRRDFVGCTDDPSASRLHEWDGDLHERCAVFDTPREEA